MNAARPHIVNFEDTEADDLYDLIGRDAACIGRWDDFAPRGGTNSGPTRLRTRIAADRCAECPVFDQCERLADLLQPEAGVWAGRLHTPKHPEGIPI